MARRNSNNRREQAPKPRMPRMPFPDECKMGGDVFESKRPRFEEEEAMPMQCCDCGAWWSDDDLSEDGLCEDCEREYDEYEKELSLIHI